MNTDKHVADLERMAREAGYDVDDACITMPHFHTDGPADERAFLARFADLVRADERERAAKVCASIADVVASSAMGARRDAGINTAAACAAAIRALSAP